MCFPLSPGSATAPVCDSGVSTAGDGVVTFRMGSDKRTEPAGELHRHHRSSDHETMRRLLPVQREYPLPQRIHAVGGGD